MSSESYPVVHCSSTVPVPNLWTLVFPLPPLTLFSLSDRAIGEIQTACEEAGYALLITADHGNAERMIDEEGKPVTKHTTFRGGTQNFTLL